MSSTKKSKHSRNSVNQVATASISMLYYKYSSVYAFGKATQQLNSAETDSSNLK